MPAIVQTTFLNVLLFKFSDFSEHLENILAQKELDAKVVDEIKTVIAQADALSKEEMALTLKVIN